MTKLNHGNPYRPADPGAVRTVAEVTRPYKPPKTDAERKREKEALAADEAKQAEALRPELERQERREARKQLRNCNYPPNTLTRILLERKAAIPEPPRKKL